MAFQTPFEIAQSQLQRLALSSVEAREVVGGIFPFFDDTGATRFLVIDTLSAGRPESDGGLWVVEEFPLEIRLHKAIYPRPIARYLALADLDAEAFEGLYHFDPRAALPHQPFLNPQVGATLAARNLAARHRGRERVRDIFYTRDLRRVTGGASRSGFLFRRRLELAALRSFIQTSTAPVSTAHISTVRSSHGSRPAVQEQGNGGTSKAG